MAKINHWVWEDKITTTSTNDDALIKSKHVKGRNFLISTQEQTKGRGRRGRQWVSLPGNLFFSQGIVVDTSLLGQLVILSGYSLYQTIKNVFSGEHKIQIKWPNDVLIDNKKVSGMLLEKGENDYFIIGIGVNIVAAPKSGEMHYPVTSLQANGIDIDRLSFLRSYIDNFDNNYHHWQEEGFADIKEKWLTAVRGLEEEISVQTGTESQRGIFKGIGDNGELLLFQNGAVKKIYAGDVFYDKEHK